MTSKTDSAAPVRELGEFLWEQSPGHFGGAMSKILVSQAQGSQVIDYRISTYLPGAYVQLHSHEAKEQIYCFIEGEGLLQIADRKTVVKPGQFVFIPPRVPHALHNTCNGQLVFWVVTAPVPPDGAKAGG